MSTIIFINNIYKYIYFFFKYKTISFLNYVIGYSELYSERKKIKTNRVTYLICCLVHFGGHMSKVLDYFFGVFCFTSTWLSTWNKVD